MMSPEQKKFHHNYYSITEQYKNHSDQLYVYILRRYIVKMVFNSEFNIL